MKDNLFTFGFLCASETPVSAGPDSLDLFLTGVTLTCCGSSIRTARTGAVNMHPWFASGLPKNQAIRRARDIACEPAKPPRPALSRLQTLIRLVLRRPHQHQAWNSILDLGGFGSRNRKEEIHIPQRSSAIHYCFVSSCRRLAFRYCLPSMLA